MVSPCSAKTGAVALITAFWASVSGTMSLGTPSSMGMSTPHRWPLSGCGAAGAGGSNVNVMVRQGGALGRRWVSGSTGRCRSHLVLLRRLCYIAFLSHPKKKPISCEVYMSSGENASSHVPDLLVRDGQRSVGLTNTKCSKTNACGAAQGRSALCH